MARASGAVTTKEMQQNKIHSKEKKKHDVFAHMHMKRKEMDNREPTAPWTGSL